MTLSMDQSRRSNSIEWRGSRVSIGSSPCWPPFPSVPWPLPCTFPAPGPASPITTSIPAPTTWGLVWWGWVLVGRGGGEKGWDWGEEGCDGVRRGVVGWGEEGGMGLSMGQSRRLNSTEWRGSRVSIGSSPSWPPFLSVPWSLPCTFPAPGPASPITNICLSIYLFIYLSISWSAAS